MNTIKSSFIAKTILVFALLTLLTVKINAFAEEKKQEPVELEEYFTFLEEEFPPVITGISRPLKKEEVPASITVITADEISLLGLRHLTDVINFIVPGGVGDIHRSSRTGLYAFRGITVDNNGKYVFMVDGLNVGNLTEWGAFNERYLGLMDELDRIEIIQGTGSILYGSGAISGIINFITKTGKTFQGTEVTAGYGSWDKVEASYKYGEKKSDTEDSFYYFGFKRSQGSRPRGGTVKTVQTIFPVDNQLGKLSATEAAGPGRHGDHFDNSGKVHVNINRGDFSLRLRYVRDRFEEPYVRGGLTRDTSDDYWFENYFFVQPEIRHKLSEVSRIKANISFVMNESGFEKIEDWISIQSGTPRLIVSEGDRVKSTGEKKVRAQLFHYYDGWENHRLTRGAELFWMHSGPDFAGGNYSFRSSGGFRTKTSKKITPENLYFGALFFEDIWKLSDKTTLFTGARLEDHSRTKPSFSPRIAISHDYSKKTNLKLLYNRGFRTPDWVYFDVNKNNGVSRPRPERVDSFEAHLLHKFNEKFSTSLVGYYTIYKDIINFARSVGGYANFPTVESMGLEASGTYRSENLKLSVSHSYSKPFDTGEDNFDDWGLTADAEDWAQFPTHMTKAQLIYHLVQDKCILGLTYFRPWGIKGHLFSPAELERGADYLNATMTFKLDKNLELQTSIYNIFGEDHPWWGFDTRNGFSRAVNPHTEYFIRLKWKF